MKRILLLSVVVGLSTGQACADLFELDVATVQQFTHGWLEGWDDVVGYESGDDWLVSGPTLSPPDTHYGTMSGAVGFRGAAEDWSGDGTTIFWVYNATDTALLPLRLSGSGYDGITAYFSNDNNTAWSFQLYYLMNDATHTEYNSGDDFVTLAAGESTYLTVLHGSSGGLNLADIYEMGFGVLGVNNSGDTFHVSLVPVPGAVLLGLLGLGAAGLRLRRFA